MGNRGFFGFSSGSDIDRSWSLFSELDLWLAADTLVGYSDGQAVGTWPDNSGHGRDAVQGGGSLQPIYKPSVYGLPVLQFDNTDDAMTTSCVITGSYSIFAVYASISAASYSGRAVQGSTNWLLGPRATYHQAYDGALIQGPGVVANALVCSALLMDASGGSFYVNGTYIGANANNGAPGTIGLGRGGNNAEGLNGYLGEVLAYSRTLNPTERAAVEAYLISKWGIV